MPYEMYRAKQIKYISTQTEKYSQFKEPNAA